MLPPPFMASGGLRTFSLHVLCLQVRFFFPAPVFLEELALSVASDLNWGLQPSLNNSATAVPFQPMGPALPSIFGVRCPSQPVPSFEALLPRSRPMSFSSVSFLRNPFDVFASFLFTSK